jgi:adenine deaminase
LGLVELPIAGLMNDLDAHTMSEKVHSVERAWEEIGCTMPSPFMTMALIPLACLPELRLTNRGLVDCTTFQFVDLFV